MKSRNSQISIVFLAAIGIAASGCSVTKNTNLQKSIVPEKSSVALAFAADQVLRDKLSSKARTALSAAESQALDFGQPGETITWQSPKEKQSGNVIAYQPFRIGDSNCRRFVHKVIIGLDKLNASGTACRDGGSAWALVE